MQAAILNGESSKAVKDILLVDVVPLSLGIETIGGVMNVIIKRNSHIPVKKTRNYTTSCDNQTTIPINIF